MKPTYEELELKIAEQDKLIKQLLERIANLEAQISKNSKNSSKPPSSDQKPNISPDTKKGSRPFHPGASRKLLPESSVTSFENRTIEQCPSCQSEMMTTGEVTSWQQIDLPEIKPLVHQINLYTCRCKQCHLEVVPELREDEKLLLGSRLEALINLCLGQFRQSHRTVREFIGVLIPELELSQGLISKIKNRAAKALDLAYQQITNEVLDTNQPTHIDATGWRHKSKNEHAIVIRVGNVVKFALVQRQNGDTLRGLMQGRKIMLLVSDRGLAISKIDNIIHQYCLAHLLRNICGLAEHPATSISNAAYLGEIYDAIQELFVDKHRFEQGKIKQGTWRQYGYATWGFIEEKIEKILENQPGKKVKAACERIQRDFTHFKVYLRDPEYPMTNNLAEEALRNLVITRKLCFGSHSEYGRQWRASIQSCIETLRRQGRSVLDFLTEVISSSRTGTPYPVI